MGIGKDVSVDRENKLIIVRCGKYHVAELYDYLKTVFADNECPMEAVDPTLFRMMNGWRLTDESSFCLKGAGIMDEYGNEWCNIYVLGKCAENTRITVKHEDEIVEQGYLPFDRLIKVKENGVRLYDKLTVIGEVGVNDSWEAKDLKGRVPVPLATCIFY